MNKGSNFSPLVYHTCGPVFTSLFHSAEPPETAELGCPCTTAPGLGLLHPVCTSYNTNNNNNVAWVRKLFISSHLEGDEENDVTPIKVHAAIAGTDLQLVSWKLLSQMYISSRTYNVYLNPSHPFPCAMCIFHVHKLQTSHRAHTHRTRRLFTSNRAKLSLHTFLNLSKLPPFTLKFWDSGFVTKVIYWYLGWNCFILI